MFCLRYWQRHGAQLITHIFLGGGNWSEGTSDCLNDCILFVDDEEIQYHSGCGTFNDTVNEKSLHLTEEQQAEVNAILEKYIALEQSLDGVPVTEEKSNPVCGKFQHPTKWNDKGRQDIH